MRKILIADGDSASILYYRIILKNFNLITVNCGAEAIKKIAEEKPDLIIVSNRLKIISGLELIEETRMTDKITPIIMIASYPQAKQQAINLGCNAFYVKPISQETILEIVRHALSAN